MSNNSDLQHFKLKIGTLVIPVPGNIQIIFGFSMIFSFRVRNLYRTDRWTDEQNDLL